LLWLLAASPVPKAATTSRALYKLLLKARI